MPVEAFSLLDLDTRHSALKGAPGFTTQRTVVHFCQQLIPADSKAHLRHWAHSALLWTSVFWTLLENHHHNCDQPSDRARPEQHSEPCRLEKTCKINHHRRGSVEIFVVFTLQFPAPQHYSSLLKTWSFFFTRYLIRIWLGCYIHLAAPCSLERREGEQSQSCGCLPQMLPNCSLLLKASLITGITVTHSNFLNYLSIFATHLKHSTELKTRCLAPVHQQA